MVIYDIGKPSGMLQILRLALLITILALCFNASYARRGRSTDTSYYDNGRIESIWTLRSSSKGRATYFDSTSGLVIGKGRIHVFFGPIGRWRIFTNGEYSRTVKY